MCFCFQALCLCSLRRWMVVLFLTEKTKAPSFYSCNQLSALWFMYVDIFTLNKMISTSYNNSMNYEGVLYMEPVLWWHAWERQMAAVQFPFSPEKKRETYVWPLIMWRGATDLVWGETKGCLLVRFVSWLWPDFFARIYCSAAKTQEAQWDQQSRSPSPRPSKSWMISKWSPARPPVDSIQSIICVIVFLLFISRRKYSGDVASRWRTVQSQFMQLYTSTSQYFKGNVVLLTPLHLCPTL